MLFWEAGIWMRDLDRIDAIQSRAGFGGWSARGGETLDISVQIVCTNFMLRSNGGASPPPPNFDLTRIRRMAVARTQETRELLAQAGLEIWQAPEGFWAVRLKQAAVPPRRRALRKTK